MDKASLFSTTQEAVQFEILTQDPDTLPAHPRILITSIGLIAFLCICYPLCFGGVHERVFLSTQCLISAVFILNLYFYQSALVKLFRQQPLFRLSFSILSVIGLYFLAQFLLFKLLASVHPVLGSASSVLDARAFSFGLQQLATFVMVFTITSLVILIKDSTKWVNLAMISGGALVGIVALSHWFYDNGRLFWVFEPESIFVSDRARWPFVSANSLAQFLLPLFFLMLGVLANKFVKNFESSKLLNQAKSMSDVSYLISHKSLQRKIIHFIGYSIGLLLILLAIVASLSRTGWLALSTGLVTWVVLGMINSDSRSSPNYRLSSSHMTMRRRARRSGSSSNSRKFQLEILKSKLLKVGRPILLLCAAITFIFFINGQASDRISQRVEFGLASSLDDIRWTMYNDSIALFKSAPILGLGLGSWSQAFNAVRSTSLAGMNPVYLHSDIFQFLIEGGLVAFILALSLVIILTKSTVTALKNRTPKSPYLLISAFSGYVALLTTALFDFPFRIPAICAEAAILLAILVYKAQKPDQAEQAESRNTQ